MAAPDRAFNEVKSILRKLDRDIQSARDRRLGVDPLPDEQNTSKGRDIGAGLQPGNADSSNDRNNDQARNNNSNTPGRDANDGGRHGFGRARPKPRPSSGS